MSTARNAILDTLRRQLKRGVEAAARHEVQQRLAQPPQHTIPQRSLLPRDEQIELFVRMAEQADAGVQRLSQSAAIPAAVAEFMRRRQFPAELVMAPDPELLNLPWGEQPQLQTRAGAAGADDKVCLSLAFAGIAETGTLMLLSGPHSPTTLNFLPDAHIVVLTAERIVGPYEAAWQRLRAQAGGMPRTVNLITGPSRSADIEQTLQLGAHGPIHLHIILID